MLYIICYMLYVICYILFVIYITQVQYPPLWSHDEWCREFHLFLNEIGIRRVG